MPVLQDSTVDEMANCINKYVICSVSDKKVSPTLHNRVINYQTHKHNLYCLRKKKTKQVLQPFAGLGFFDTSNRISND